MENRTTPTATKNTAARDRQAHMGEMTTSLQCWNTAETLLDMQRHLTSLSTPWSCSRDKDEGG